MLISLFELVDTILSLFVWSLLAYVIASWLIVFRIVNPNSPIVRQILQGLTAIHEPILYPIRVWQYRLIPNMGGFDLSPVVVLLGLEYIVRPLFRSVVFSLIV